MFTNCFFVFYLFSANFYAKIISDNIKSFFKVKFAEPWKGIFQRIVLNSLFLEGVNNLLFSHMTNFLTLVTKKWKLVEPDAKCGQSYLSTVPKYVTIMALIPSESLNTVKNTDTQGKL